MTTFLIIALSLIVILLIGCFITLSSIWVNTSPKAQAALATLAEMDRLKKDVKKAHNYHYKATYGDGDLIKAAWEGIEAANKINSGESPFRTQSITVTTAKKKPAKKKPAPKKTTKKPAKKTRK